MAETSPAAILKSAEGHVAHYTRLIEQYTFRRDQGDCVPDAESLTRWIEQAEAEKTNWERQAEKAKDAAEAPPPPLG